MARIPSAPAARSAGTVDLLYDALAERASSLPPGWDRCEAATQLARVGRVEAARALGALLNPPERVLQLAWLTRAAGAAAGDEVRAAWSAYAASLDPSKPHRSERVLGWCACALAGVDAGSSPPPLGDSNAARMLFRTLVALGRGDEAFALIREHGLWREGVGFAVFRLTVHNDALGMSIPRWIARERRWDRLAALAACYVAMDDMFLGPIKIRLALVPAAEATAGEALAALPDAMLRKCFLAVLAAATPEDRAALAALAPRLDDVDAAIVAAIFAGPARAQVDPTVRSRHRLALAIARGDASTFDEVANTLGDAWNLQRSLVAAVRVLRVRGGDDSDAWLDRVEALARAVSREHERARVLCELSYALCAMGWRARGEGLLTEALALADALPRTERGRLRSDALEQVCAYATRAEAYPVALAALRKCTAKLKRDACVPPLVTAFARLGDFSGALALAERISTPSAQAAALVAAVRATLPDGRELPWMEPPRDAVQ